MRLSAMSAILIVCLIVQTSLKPLSSEGQSPTGQSKPVTTCCPGHAPAPDSGVVVLAEDHSLPESTAARELSEYLSKVTGGEFPIVSEADAPATGKRIFVGPTVFASEQGLPTTDDLGQEEWIIRSIDDEQSLVIIGGRPRGTLYGAYQFLENVVGVHWWNEWEESVPRKAKIEIAGLDLRGEPAFNYRDIYMQAWIPEEMDRGRFAARNRVNRQGDMAIGAEYGGEVGYGLPYMVHTFNFYFPPEQYFETNPEYFSLIGGERSTDLTQLCLSNEELREIFVAKLREYIEQSEATAVKNNLPLPLVYEVSPNDWTGACECDDCQAIAVAEGTETGPLLDFVNYMADAIKDDYPHIQIGTLAYLHTEAIPKNMKPRDNVSIRLCDTASNITRTLLTDDNRRFRKLVEEWSKITKHLRIWDYVVTFGVHYGLPVPNLRTFPTNYQFFLDHGVEGIFSESPGPVSQDMRDLKVWMMAKLKENPYADYDRLIMTFTEGFYGPAGKYVREYLTGLEASADQYPSYIALRPTPPQNRYLHLDFVLEAHNIFDKAQEAVEDDQMLMRRIRHARMPLDRATAYLYSQLLSEWMEQGHDREDFPLVRQEIVDRYSDTWIVQLEMRQPNHQESSKRPALDREINRIMALPEYVEPPSYFVEYDSWRVFDFPAYTARNYKGIAVIVEDEDAESGEAVRLEFPTKIDTDHHPLEKYLMPMVWGLYDRADRMPERAGQIKPEDVPGPGYHWHKMGTFSVVTSDFVYLFPTHIVQFDIGNVPTPERTDQQFEIWGRFKFEGPAFPHGKETDANAIIVERLVVLEVTGLDR